LTYIAPVNSNFDKVVLERIINGHPVKFE
jgi:hypothetical protein